ncbi:MAG: NAD(+) synthase [Nanoarchaeota archaeon]
MNRIKLPEMDPELVSREIGDFVIDTLISAHATGCVIGLSGGVDSTTTAALIKRAFDRYNAAIRKPVDFAAFAIFPEGNSPPLELVAYILPSNLNSQKDNADGISVAERLGIRYEVISLDKLIDAYATTNPEALDDSFHRGNLISRIRANVLNTKAATEKKAVAGTGNRDEDYGIGYYTLFGDGAVHMSPIGALSKRLVRQMAADLGFSDLANREPTAGLEQSQTDFKDLGYRYDIVELVSEGLDQGFSPEELATHEQIAPVVRQQFTEYRTLYGKDKFTTVPEVVSDIIRRKKIAAAKAEIIHPPIPLITLQYR